MPSQHPLQDNYKSETTTAIQTLKSDYATATTTCNQLTQQLDKQQVEQRAELAALQEFHAASLNEQQLEADGLRQQLQAAQARAATAEEQLAALKAASEEDAATITKLQANVAGVAALLAVLACCVTVTDRLAWPTSAAWCFRQLFMCKCAGRSCSHIAGYAALCLRASLPLLKTPLSSVLAVLGVHCCQHHQYNHNLHHQSCLLLMMRTPPSCLKHPCAWSRQLSR